MIRCAGVQVPVTVLVTVVAVMTFIPSPGADRLPDLPSCLCLERPPADSTQQAKIFRQFANRTAPVLGWQWHSEWLFADIPRNYTACRVRWTPLGDLAGSWLTTVGRVAPTMDTAGIVATIGSPKAVVEGSYSISQRCFSLLGPGASRISLVVSGGSQHGGR